jgi:hypothetical protein
MKVGKGPPPPDFLKKTELGKHQIVQKAAIRNSVSMCILSFLREKKASRWVHKVVLECVWADAGANPAGK